jgi:hypothetical protein
MQVTWPAVWQMYVDVPVLMILEVGVTNTDFGGDCSMVIVDVWPFSLAVYVALNVLLTAEPSSALSADNWSVPLDEAAVVAGASVADVPAGAAADAEEDDELFEPPLLHAATSTVSAIAAPKHTPPRRPVRTMPPPSSLGHLARPE